MGQNRKGDNQEGNSETQVERTMNTKSVRYFIEKSNVGSDFLQNIEHFIKVMQKHTENSLRKQQITFIHSTFKEKLSVQLQIILHDKYVKHGKINFDDVFFEVLRYTNFPIYFYPKFVVNGEAQEQFEKWCLKRDLEEI